MSIYQPCSTDLFFKSTKAGDSRLGEFVSQDIGTAASYSIAGYPDDEGIRLNGGRIGAAAAPNTIRKYFYKMTPSPWGPAKDVSLWDAGNLIPSDALEDRHTLIKNDLANILSPAHRRITLGGGHDYGYPDGAGFLLSLKNETHKPLIINFDAHLDVRPTDQGISSGTPFFRLLTDTELPAFDFIEAGLQPQCNSRAHVEWLSSKGGLCLTLDELLADSNLADTFLQKTSPYLLQQRPTFISVDIDAFSSAYAPGCSQSWSTGFAPNDFMRLLKMLQRRLDIRLLSIYEVSPPLDNDDRTSKLAAQIMHTFIYS